MTMGTVLALVGAALAVILAWHGICIWSRSCWSGGSRCSK